MGRGMKLPSLFRQRGAAAPPWRQWPLCKNPRTLSSRLGDDVFKTVNSMFFEQNRLDIVVDSESPVSCFTNSSEAASFSTDRSERDLDAESIETVVREVVRSERLFFEPIETSSILKEAKVPEEEGEADRREPPGAPFKESVAVAVETVDPYWDFRRSMEEMMSWQAVGKDWECLEAMLGWYLRMNKKEDHGTIVGAFIDCVVSMASGGCGDSGPFASVSAASASEYATCHSSVLSSSSRSPPWCPSQRHNEIEEADGDGDCDDF